MENFNSQNTLVTSTKVKHIDPVFQTGYNDQGKFVKCKIWIVETGASSHIACSIEKFKNIRHVSNWHVLLPNGLKLKATLKGDIVFYKNLMLIDVLYVPSFAYNLLSVT